MYPSKNTVHHKLSMTSTQALPQISLAPYSREIGNFHGNAIQLLYQNLNFYVLLRDIVGKLYNAQGKMKLILVIEVK